jgi:hypothetical protein
MQGWLYRNGLSLAVLGTFFLLFMGQIWVGWQVHNDDLARHGIPVLDLVGYLGSGHFHEATSENWESEFLQMGCYVLLTVFLRQQGSAESKHLAGSERVDALPAPGRVPADAPWPVRRGGLWLKLYEHSLTLAFLLLFLLSFSWHVVGGLANENTERHLAGRPTVTLADYFASAQFWFESLQNWQSEFLAVGSIVVLSIWLRQRGSPESKPVAAPHRETGG